MRRDSLINRRFILCGFVTLVIWGALPAEERPAAERLPVAEVDAAPLARVNGEPISETDQGLVSQPAPAARPR
jgi:hypothetical protein